MRPRDHRPYAESGPGRNGGRFDLFYYEKVGERFYLRLTPLAAGLLLGLTLLSVAGILLLFLYNSNKSRPADNVNVQITTPPAAPTPLNPIILPAKPAPSPPRVITPAPPSPAGNGSPRVSPTPQPGRGDEDTHLKASPTP